MKLYQKYVVIIFDDGYLNNYINAFPNLLKYNLKAAFFVIVDRIGSPNYLTWKHLEEMIECSMDVQSHTLSHELLVSLPKHSLEQELLAAKTILQEKLKNCTVYEFPTWNL